MSVVHGCMLSLALLLLPPASALQSRSFSLRPSMPRTTAVSTTHRRPQQYRSGSFLGSPCCRTLLPTRRKTAAATNLSMHMGHSHSRHTHVHHDHDDNENQSTSTTSGGAAGLPKIKPRRLIAMFVFSAVATLGPSLWRRGTIGRSDAAAFGLVSLALSVSNAMGREIHNGFQKLKRLRNAVLRHTPQTPFRPRKYFLENENAADRVTLLGVAVNILLSVGKFVVGVTCHSSALIADAGHSLSDLFSDFVTLYSVQIARLPADEDHPYGHGKFEAIGSLFLALTLLGTGISVGAVANKELLQIIAMQRTSGLAAAAVKVPKAPALIMAGLSIASKEWLYRITRRVGESLNSQVVIANAWHHRSDAYSSILALLSIGLAMAVPGLVAADSAAGILVAGMICMTGADIMGESINQLADSSNDDLVQKVKDIAADHEDVVEVERIRARQVGSSALVDVSVVTPTALSSSAIRTVEQRIKQRIMEEHSNVMDAEVRGTNQGPQQCPLLTATAIHHDKEYPSVSQVESTARELIAQEPAVAAVHAVTVHYEDPLNASVDVDIRFQNASMSVAGAQELATSLRESLEDSPSIHKAHIFLDLNADDDDSNNKLQRVVDGDDATMSKTLNTTELSASSPAP